MAEQFESYIDAEKAVKKSEKVLKETIIAFVIMLVAVVPSILWSGYVLQVLWGWFITPAFGLAVPSTGIVLGLALIVGWITTQHSHLPDERTPYEKLGATLSVRFLFPALMLLSGWILTFFI